MNTLQVRAWTVMVLGLLAGCGGSKPVLSSDAGPGLAASRAGASAVSGGATMTSTHHRLITTTGQGPGDNATMSSPHHVFVGGVVGATQAQ